MRALCRATLAAVAIVLAAPAAESQVAPPPHLSASFGLFQYDLAGSGVGPMLAVRALTPISSVLTVEAGALLARPRQAGEITPFVVPEAQVQLLLPFTGVVPYMGLGAGTALDFRSRELGGRGADLTISGSLGARMLVRDRLGIQAELRVRGVGVDFERSASEWTLGLTRPL